MFHLDQFIADLRATLADRSRQAMKDVVARAVSDPIALRRTLGEPNQAGLTVLYSSPELTVLDLIWAPQQVTLPHDHRMTAIIGMYTGREDNLFWRRVPNPARYQIDTAGGCALGTGDVTILGSDLIHSVINPLAKLSGALHVYTGDFLAAERSMWDAETLAEERYDIGVALKGMPVFAG